MSALEQEGKTILLSTHDVDFAYRFAQRVIVFHEGTILADDVPERIFQDEKLLKKANLKKPLMLQVYELLQKRGIVSGNTVPQNIEQLSAILSS